MKNESTEEEEEEKEEEEEEALPFLIRLLPEERKGAKILLIHSQRDFFLHSARLFLSVEGRGFAKYSIIHIHQCN